MPSTIQENTAFAVIDKWLGYKVRTTDLPGLQLCVRRKGECLFSRAYGHANLKTGRLYTTTDLGHIASHSKMFATCAVLILAQADKLRLDQLAVDFLPWLADHKDKRASDITVRDLVSNRAGVIRDGSNSPFWSLREPFPDAGQLHREVLASDLFYDPNTVTKYSNFGFSLVGEIVARASGVSFAAFVEREILSKLPEAVILVDYAEAEGRVFADGHSRPAYDHKRLPVRHATANAMDSATGFCANAESISLFLHHYLFEDTFLQAHTRRDLMNLDWPVANSKTQRYGMGLSSGQHEAIVYIGHGGGWPGFSSRTCNWKGTDYIVGVICNTNVDIDQIVVSIMDIMAKVGQAFAEDELADVTVSDVMLDMWHQQVFAVTDRKAIAFDVGGWDPAKDQTIMTRNTSGGYVTDKINGYYNLNENTRFDFTSGDRIVAVQASSSYLLPEAADMARAKMTLL